MYLGFRTLKDGSIQYRFTYLDAHGKRRRYPQAEVPNFSSRAEAEAWAKSKAAEMSAKKRESRRRVEWRKKYHDFEALLEQYARWQKDRAPNSWTSSVSYLSDWVFPYFLQKLDQPNVHEWRRNYQTFLDWLRGPHEGRAKPLAASTVNNITKALNTFLTSLVAYNQIEPSALHKIPALPEHMLNRRSFKDVVLEPEMRKVHAQLVAIHPPAADFFITIWSTGMRFSELFGLPITALFRGPVPNKDLDAELKKCGVTYHGYIYLESQPKHDDRRRDEHGVVQRKPLKSHKEISPRHARIIPIRTTEVWNILAKRHKKGIADHTKNTFGPDKSNYMLFEDLEWNKATLSLQAAYKQAGLEYRAYHSCRHTFTTLLVGETRSFFLVRAITGHRKDQSFERYLHIYERIGLEAQQNEQVIDELLD